MRSAYASFFASSLFREIIFPGTDPVKPIRMCCTCTRCGAVAGLTGIVPGAVASTGVTVPFVAAGASVFLADFLAAFFAASLAFFASLAALASSAFLALEATLASSFAASSLDSDLDSDAFVSAGGGAGSGAGATTVESAETGAVESAGAVEARAAVTGRAARRKARMSPKGMVRDDMSCSVLLRVELRTGRPRWRRRW